MDPKEWVRLVVDNGAGAAALGFLAWMVARMFRRMERQLDAIATGNGTATGGLKQLHEKVDRMEGRLADGDERMTRIEDRLNERPCIAGQPCPEPEPARRPRARKDAT